MLNKLTKCCSILAMFALYFLSAPGAAAQCEIAEEQYSVLVSPSSSFPTETGWRIETADGVEIAASGATTTSETGPPAPISTVTLSSATEYVFVFVDSWGDGWDGGTVNLIRTVDQTPVLDNVPGSTSGSETPLNFTTPPAADCLVEGCTEPYATNYDPYADVDDGSCVYSCVQEGSFCYGNNLSPTQALVALQAPPSEMLYIEFLTGSTEAGWDYIYVYDNVDPSQGNVIYENFTTGGGSVAGVIAQSTTGQISIAVASDESFSCGGTTSIYYITYETYCTLEGCTDPSAVNFNSIANVDDGSCLFTGCTDNTACNFDANAQEDDGSCAYGDVTLSITDNTWSGETSWELLDAAGEVVASGDGYSNFSDIEEDLCLPDGCYTWVIYDSWGDGFSDFGGQDGVWSVTSNGYTVIEGANWVVSPSAGTEVSFEAGTFCVPTVAGCTDALACNYAPLANFDDGTCDYSCVGCMDTSAANYDPNATIQGEGSCVFCEAGTFVMNIEMTDAGGDGWEGAQYFLTALATDSIISGAWDNAGLYLGDLAVDFLCMPLGCYTFSVGGGSAISEVGATVSDQFGTTYLEGTGAIATTNVDFGLTGLCDFEGCTDPYCWNFDISATIDDLSCICPPVNNAVEDAIALECGSVVNGTVANASDVEDIVGQMFGGHTINQGGVWYQYNASGTQQVFIDLCGTPDAGFAAGTEMNDSQIHVFVEDNDGNLVMVASNDESCFSHAGVSIVTDVAETYYIHVSAYSAGGGDQFRISVNCTEACTTGTPFNDDCEGALPQLDGIAFSGSTCCTNQEGGWTAGNVDYGAGVLSGASTYGVWFTFNSGDFDTFDFNLLNGDGAAVSLSIYYSATNCDEVATSTVFVGGGIAGCNVTAQCAGSISQITDLIPNTDYFFLVGTTEPGECGTFSFSTTGVYLGCTDQYALNYNTQATEDDGSCDYEGLTPFNDLCENAAPLLCNTGYSEYSMGGATEDVLPICEEGVDYAGCLNTTWSWGQWPSNTLTPSCDGNIELLEDGLWAGEYSRISVDAGVTYTFAMSDPTIFLTVSNGLGTQVLATGIGEVEFESELDGNIRLYRHIADCQGDSDNMELYASCGETPGGGVWFTFEGTGELHNINTCGSVLDTQLQMFTAAGGSCDSLACTTQLDGTIALNQTSFDDCGFFDQDDASLNFISEPGVTYYVYVGSDLANNGSFQIEMSCEEAVYGCMVDIACNYNPLANIEDDCDFTSCTCTDETQTAIVIEMFDDFGDGWSGGNDGSMGGYEIQDMDGNVYASGTLEEALYQVDEDNYQGPEYGIDTQCLDDGCYFFVFTTADIWAEEQSWSLTVNGEQVAGASYTDADNSTTFEYAFTIGDFDCGCTDDFACNFDGVAPDWVENGTCEYITCAGCTDPENCFYDGPEFTIDDGSCCTDNCITIQMYDSWGDGWQGNTLTIKDLEGNVIQTATITFAQGASNTEVGCLPDGCYTVECGGGFSPSEVSWDLLGVYGGMLSGGVQGATYFSVGGNNCIEGCAISCACNYDAAVNIPNLDDCTFDGCGGCTYEDATNFDSSAIADDGTCVFDTANPCPADLNEDGSVSTADLLQFLGAFGTVCE